MSAPVKRAPTMKPEAFQEVTGRYRPGFWRTAALRFAMLLEQQQKTPAAAWTVETEATSHAVYPRGKWRGSQAASMNRGKAHRRKLRRIAHESRRRNRRRAA